MLKKLSSTATVLLVACLAGLTMNVRCPKSGTAPEITGAIPRDGETDVRLTMYIEVHFTKDMEQATAEDAFSIYPVVPGRFEWPTPKTMKFVPSAPFQPSTYHTYSVGISACALNGGHLATIYTSSFTTADSK